MEVDGVLNCFSLDSVTESRGSPAYLKAGIYKAKITNNSTTGCLETCGAMEPVVLTIPSLQPKANSIQSLTTNQPVFFNMPTDGYVYGFFTDTICGDNSGTATVQFIRK